MPTLRIEPSETPSCYRFYMGKQEVTDLINFAEIRFFTDKKPDVRLITVPGFQTPDDIEIVFYAGEYKNGNR